MESIFVRISIWLWMILCLILFWFAQASNPALAWKYGNTLPSITFGTPVNYNVANYPTSYVEADSWGCTWDSLGNNICGSDDNQSGWAGAGPASNIQIDQLSGITTSLTGSLVNGMSGFGVAQQAGSDTFNYKDGIPSSIQGTLYAGVSRTGYGASPTWKQSQQNSQIIKSTDHGVNWTPQPPSTAQPYTSPMFPGTMFGYPMFAQYGQDYQGNTVDNSGTYVYATSSNGIWTNADYVYLGRVKISNIGNLSASDWSWYIGGDGMLDASWSSTLSSAIPIISNPGQLSVGALQWMPAFGKYVVIFSYYPSINNATPSNNTASTVWNTYTSLHPWGPYTLLQTNAWSTLGLYTPTIMPKSLSVDGGHTALVLTAGDYSSICPSNCPYTLTMVPMTIP